MSIKPMYRTYINAWEKYSKQYGSKTALLYQVGGFFEIYDVEDLTTGKTQANVREIADICQLSLTVHALDDSTQSLFGGLPEGALSKYERILVGAGFTVVIVTQRKDIGGKVEDRVVERISSPGCYTESGSVTERRLVGCFLESLSDGPAALRRVYWASVAIDLATGHIWFVEGTDRDRLHQFLCVHPPSEMVLWVDGGVAAISMAEMLRNGAGTSSIHVRCTTSESVAIDEAILGRYWSPVRTKLEWIAWEPQARRCLAALMEFAADHQPSALLNLQTPIAWINSHDVRLGNAALEQLGVLTLRRDTEKQSLLGLLDQCRSVAGRRLLRDRIMRPITNVTELERRLDMIDAATKGSEKVDITATTERALRSLYDMSRLWRKLELHTASVTDLLLFVRSTEAIGTLLDVWTASPTETGLKEKEKEKKEWCQYVTSQWSIEILNEMSREGVTVPVKELPHRSPPPAIVELFERGLKIRNQAVALVTEWSTSNLGATSGILNLVDAEGGGFRVTGTKKRISTAHAFLRDKGDESAEMTTYKTSSALDNKHLRAISMMHRTWWSEWVEVWNTFWISQQLELVEKGRIIHAALEIWCAELDVSWTMARIAKEWLWKRPILVSDATESWISVEKLRHPILERLTSVSYVPHTISLGSSVRGLLLYGMNAAGKSSLMKSVGLCVLLAQCGFPVPAVSCRLSPFSALFTRILGNDNLWAGLSSFAVEMTEFREILRFADEHSLVLGDELCSGTESLSGTALVAAGVETLAARKTKFVFATHLHELATLPSITSLHGVRAVHLRVRYDSATDRLIYDRELAEGAGSALYGLEVCRALDLPVDFLERATVLRKQLSGEVTASLSHYSTKSVMDVCGVCGTNKGRLESHHIWHQSDAAGAASAGISLHSPGNLVCLCEKCHDEHHAGRLEIKGWEETSSGKHLIWSLRTVTDSSSSSPSPTVENEKDIDKDDLPEEVIKLVRQEKQFKSRVPVQRIQRVVKNMFGITLTADDIRRL